LIPLLLLFFFFAQAEAEVKAAVAARDAAEDNANAETLTSTTTTALPLDALIEGDEFEKENGDEHALVHLDDETVVDRTSLGNDSESDQGSQGNAATESKVQWSDEEND
jgi:hypothetical protein